MEKLSQFKFKFVDGEKEKVATFSILNNELLLDAVRERKLENGLRIWKTIYDRYLPDLNLNSPSTPLTPEQIRKAIKEYKKNIFVTIEK